MIIVSACFRCRRREKDFEFSLENTYFAKNKNNAQSADSRLARILEKSILQPGFEKLHAIPMAKENKKLLRIERKVVNKLYMIKVLKNVIFSFIIL